MKVQNVMRTEIQRATLAILLAGAPVGFAADVKENWDKECAKCHGADGKGQTRMGRQSGAKDYTDPKVQAEMDDAKAAARIKEGLKEGTKEKMKPYGDKFSAEEIKAMVTYMRAFKK
jgi:mono/diheme cytochrome c family protein